MLTEKDYCDYGLIVELEQLGMPIEIDFACGIENGQLVKTKFYPNPPSLYEAQKWLREEKQIEIVVLSFDYVGEPYFADIHMYREARCACNYATSYEEALSEGIKEAVKILKEK